MKHQIIITMFTSAAVFWTITVIILIVGCVLRKRDIAKYNSEKLDNHSNICLALNLIAFFLLFELFSFVIALFIKSIIMSMVLHFIDLYVSAWTAHRFFPRFTGRIVNFMINMKRKL